MEKQNICSVNTKLLEKAPSSEGSLAIAHLALITENYKEAEKQILGVNQRTEESVLLMSEVYYLTGRYDECKKLLSSATSDGVLSLNNEHRAALYGWMLLKEGKPQEAFSLFDSVHRSNVGKPSTSDRARLMHMGGISCFRLGRIERAKQLLGDAETHFRTNEDSFGAAEVLTAIGVVEAVTGSLYIAQCQFEDALELLNEGGPQNRKAENLQQLAIVMLKRGRASEVFPLLDDAEQIRAAYGRNLQLVRINLIRARAYIAIEEYDNAKLFLEKAKKAASEKGYAREKALAIESLGDIKFLLNQTDEAMNYYRQALDLGSEIAPQGDIVAETTRRIGSVLLKKGKHSESIQQLEESLLVSKDCMEKYEEGVALRHLAQAYLSLGVWGSAYKLSRQSIMMFRKQAADLDIAKSLLCASEVRLAWHIGDGANSKNSRRGHLDAAWSYAIDAFHAFADLDNDSGVSKCEQLMKQLRECGGVLWKRHIHSKSNRQKCGNKLFIADSPAMRKVIGMIDVSASSDEPVLITGETGTGKELVAKLVHQQSNRSDGPFIPVNCAAIPETLFEREFFGHAEGAFTGAETQSPGLCEEADGGTLFLDEIGDMPLNLQVKLLRVLQEGTFRRLGDSVERQVDLRIVCATNAGVTNLIEKGLFREDLYYRLQTIELKIPPLREREEDLDSLIELFVGKLAGKGLAKEDVLSKDALSAMRRYRWPGNVRELESVTRRMTLMAIHAGKVTHQMLPDKIKKCRRKTSVVSGNMNLAASVDRAERECIVRALLANESNRSATAKALGVSRNCLYKKMEKLQIQ